MLIEYVKAIILGIVEGITEWLPISSTGHLILFGKLLTLSFGACNDETAEILRNTFDVVIQLGAILAVPCIYWKKLVPRTKEARALWLKLALATLPAGICGILADLLCDKLFGVSLDSLLFTPAVVAGALIVYGILFLAVERLMKRRNDKLTDISAISPKHALAIGCFQALAIVPGTSRSGATVLGARMLGIGKSAAAEFSFFAAIPVIFSASALKIYKLASYTASSSLSLPPSAIPLLLVASGVSFAVSTVAIKFLTGFIKKHSFAPFGIYRILLGALVLMLLK